MTQVDLTFRELRATETTYISKMAAVVRGVAQPALVGRLIDDATHERVFSCLEAIISLHERISEQLQVARTPAEHAQAFLNVWEELNRLYVAYVTRDDALDFDELRRIMRENAPVKALCDELEASQPGSPVETGLILPCSRLPRYCLLLKHCLKHMDAENIDRPVVAHLLHLLNQLTEAINESRRLSFNRREYLEIAQELPAILSPTRVLLETHQVLIRSHGRTVQARLTLFNDAVLLCKVRHNKLRQLEFGSLADFRARAGALPVELELAGRNDVYQLCVIHEAKRNELLELLRGGD